MKKILIFAAAICVMFAISGCGGTGGGPGPGGPTDTNLPERKFWAINIVTNQPYQLDAQLLAENNRCQVWVEKGSGVTAAQATAVANEFRDKIYPSLMRALGWEDEDTGINTMQFADILGDQNGKLIILLLDIIDGYSGGGYVAGYFNPGDLLAGTNSNRADMIYMDINPGKVDTPEFYGTIAHEMQHLMNFVTSWLFIMNSDDTNGYRTGLMETWIDEGLSEAAEWIYSGEPSLGRFLQYYLDPTGLIAKGANFYVWDNYDEDYAVLNDYATVNLFFQWLRLNFGNEIYRDILSSSLHANYQAVTSAVNKAAPPSWEELLGAWHVANYINSTDTNSIFGYRNDPLLKQVKAHRLAQTGTTWSLFPGEAVYTFSSSSISAATIAGYLGGTIRYRGMGDTEPLDNVPADSTLLTYNVAIAAYNASGIALVNTTTYGTITGQIAPSTNIQSSAFGSRSAFVSGPHRIGAGDMLRRRGFDGSFNITSSTLSETAGRSVIINPKPALPVNPDRITRYRAN
jgi:hypothetical protein